MTREEFRSIVGPDIWRRMDYIRMKGNNAAHNTGKSSEAVALIVVAHPSQIVAKMKDAFWLMKEKYCDNQPAIMTIISRSTRSTDIENTLVIGAYGFKQIALFLVEE